MGLSVGRGGAHGVIERSHRSAAAPLLVSPFVEALGFPVHTTVLSAKRPLSRLFLSCCYTFISLSGLTESATLSRPMWDRGVAAGTLILFPNISF